LNSSDFSIFQSFEASASPNFISPDDAAKIISQFTLFFRNYLTY